MSNNATQPKPETKEIKKTTKVIKTKTHADKIQDVQSQMKTLKEKLKNLEAKRSQSIIKRLKKYNLLNVPDSELEKGFKTMMEKGSDAQQGFAKKPDASNNASSG